MLANERFNSIQSTNGRSRSKRKPSLFAVLLKSPIVGVLLIAGVFCVIANIYIGAYAGVQEKGYQKSQLNIKLRQLKLENDRLKLQLDQLRQPDEITKFANTIKLKQNEEMAYLSPYNQPKVAQNTD